MTFVPFTPDADTAQQLAQTELSKAMYDHSPNLLERFIQWIFERLTTVTSQLSPGEGGAGNLTVIVVLVLLVIAVIFFAVHHSRATSAPAARQRKQLFDDDRTAAVLFMAADRAEQVGDLDLAVVERFRAIMRLLDERDLIHALPGMTAQEAAQEGSLKLGHVEAFSSCAQLFDDVYYWHRHATAADLESTRELQYVVSSSEAVA